MDYTCRRQVAFFWNPLIKISFFMVRSEALKPMISHQFYQNFVTTIPWTTIVDTNDFKLDKSNKNSTEYNAYVTYGNQATYVKNIKRLNAYKK